MTDQGVRISFLNNAEEGDRIIYSGSISGVPIVFTNGLTVVDFEFTNNDSEITADPMHRVKIGATAEQSATNLKAFLENQGYVSTSFPILYRVTFVDIWNTEAIFSANERIIFDIDTISTNLSIVSFYDGLMPTTAPKYFFEYTNISNNFFRCEIYEKNFAGSATEITGRATIDKGEVKNLLDPIRGTGLTLDLEANNMLKFEDLYSKSETDFTVRLYIDKALIFQGFLIPDGIFESFTSDIWNISVRCTDGLGFLENLSFVNDNGSAFSGKISMMDVIYYSLKKTGLQLKINTYIPLYYYGITDEDIETDVLTLAYLNTERFVKSDDNTIMSCHEALTYLLTTINAVVTQEDGEWFIYRPSEFYTQSYPFFKRYEIDNTYIGLRQVNLNRVLGSHIDNVYPHHINANQQITIRGAVSAFRLNYKYGFIESFLKNGKLKHEAGTKIYDSWTVQNWTEGKNSGYLVIDPVSKNGISFMSIVQDTGETFDENEAIISEETEEVPENYTFEFKTNFISYGYPVRIRYSVTLNPTDGSDNMTMLQNGSWTSLYTNMGYLVNADYMPNSNGELVSDVFDRTFSIQSAPVPKPGKIKITMFVPAKGYTTSGSMSGVDNPPAVLVEVKTIELVNTFQGNNVVGEFHTVSRAIPPSSIIKENKTVSMGDNVNKLYTGAIYEEDQETLTKLWHRRQFPEDGSEEAKPLLRISAEDELRIAQKPMKVFSGDIYGYMGYLILMSINSIQGRFMPISYSYDTYTNITSMKSLELYAPELFDINYLKTQDFGETVKPTIVS